VCPSPCVLTILKRLIPLSLADHEKNGAIARHRDRTVLVLEDPGGVPLDQLLGQPLDSAFWLRVALGLSTAIDHLHERGVIHKDIKPANVLVSSATGQCWLTGFGLASHLPCERPAPGPPESIAGTLAYNGARTNRTDESLDRFP
jgi:serine/threonine protein kinase